MFICIEAGNGKEAIEQFNKQPVAAILMDIMIPVMSGLEATRIIRDIEKAKGLLRTPIITLTANALERDKKIAEAAGVDAYLTKPYKKEEIIHVIQSLITKPFQPSRGGEATSSLRVQKHQI